MTSFGWLSPVAGHAGSGFEPIVMFQERQIVPAVLRHFDWRTAARAFSDRNESVGIPKTARVRFKLDAGEGGQHA